VFAKSRDKFGTVKDEVVPVKLTVPNMYVCKFVLEGGADPNAPVGPIGPVGPTRPTGPTGPAVFISYGKTFLLQMTVVVKNKRGCVATQLIPSAE
jgi:hypothetical protein